MAKKKSLKRFASLFLATTLVAGALAGCGETSTDEGGSSSGNGDSDIIKIGMNLEITGNVASYGSSIAAGAELAIEEINENGGIDGRKIEFVKVDNKSQNDESVTAAYRL